MPLKILIPVIVVVAGSALVLLTEQKLVAKWLFRAAALAFVAALSRLLWAIISNYKNPWQVFIMYFLLCFFTALAGLVICDKLNFGGIKVRNRSNLSFVTNIVLFTVVLATVNSIILVQFADSYNLPRWTRNINSLFQTFSYSLQTGLTEETIFRLYLLPLVAWMISFFECRVSGRLLGWDILPILVSTIVFGLVHGSGFIYAGVSGLVFGILFIRAGWLPCVIVHFLVDFISFSLAFVIFK